LNDTVDYVLLNTIVGRNKTVPFTRIVARDNYTCIWRNSEVSRILLAVSKLNPPIGGDVEAVTVELENTEVKPIANTANVNAFTAIFKLKLKL
jgi:dihydroneopterin aldolase